MREVVFRVLAERPGHLEAQAVGAAFSAGVTLPICITAPTLEELQQPGRLALCLQRKADGPGALAVLHAWISAALELGASVGDPPRQESFGAEAWLLDPEGNRLLMLVLP